MYEYSSSLLRLPVEWKWKTKFLKNDAYFNGNNKEAVVLYLGPPRTCDRCKCWSVVWVTTHSSWCYCSNSLNLTIVKFRFWARYSNTFHQFIGWLHSWKIKYLLKLFKNSLWSWVYWCTPVIPALRRWKQEDCKFGVSLGYIVRPCLKSTMKNSIYVKLSYSLG
jgi:hypothetical protein